MLKVAAVITPGRIQRARDMRGDRTIRASALVSLQLGARVAVICFPSPPTLPSVRNAAKQSKGVENVDWAIGFKRSIQGRHVCSCQFYLQ